MKVTPLLSRLLGHRIWIQKLVGDILPITLLMTLTTSLKAKGLYHAQHPTRMWCAGPTGHWGPDPLPAPRSQPCLGT